jgi:hypothetical protein
MSLGDMAAAMKKFPRYAKLPCSPEEGNGTDIGRLVSPATAVGTRRRRQHFGSAVVPDCFDIHARQFR